MPPASTPAPTPATGTTLLDTGRPGTARTADPRREGAAAHGRRPALDGMRAIAVLSVMIYHFGNGAGSWLPGGFLGVDVFFVLSGYLITSLLLGEYARTGGIDLAGFWVRRVRRLLPAVVAVLLVVCAWTWWAAPLESRPSRRADIFWTVGYLANWHLIDRGDDYFAGFATASPLRHAWSLAVEEQFYLVWPLLVLALCWVAARVFRRRNAGLAAVGVVATVGAVLSAIAMARLFDPLAPSAAYYSTQGRVQELFVGVVLAVALAAWRRPGRRDPRVARLFGPVARRPWVIAAPAAAGLAWAFLRMSDSTPFYFSGGALLVSVVVAGLIAVLELRPDSGAARVLSWRPAVEIGRISYGVYLWHWPLVLMVPVVAAPWHLEARSQIERTVLTLLLAAVSFRFLEQPVQRDRRLLRSRPRVLAAVVGASALVVAVALPATALPGTLGQQLSVSSDRSCPGETLVHLVVCSGPSGADPAQVPPDFALLGDSTARAMGTGFDRWGENNGTTWIQAAWKRCSSTGLPVVSPIAPAPDLAAQTCRDQAPGLIHDMLATYRPKTVVIAEYWPSSQALLVNGKVLMPGTAAHAAALRKAYTALVDEIASYGGHAVFLELPPPGHSLGELYAKGRPAEHARAPVSGAGRYVDSFNAILRQVASSRIDEASTISVTDVLCPGGSCPAVIDGLMVRNDGLHYSQDFSVRISRAVLSRAGIA